MTKLHISYRNAKGHMQSADPFNCPEDAPAAVKQAAAAIVAYTVYGPPIPEGFDMTNPPPVERRRGRPAGYVCSFETRAKMAEGHRKRQERMAEIMATVAEIDPDRYAYMVEG